jgi:hypothetical protein
MRRASVPERSFGLFYHVRDRDDPSGNCHRDYKLRDIAVRIGEGDRCGPSRDCGKGEACSRGRGNGSDPGRIRLRGKRSGVTGLADGDGCGLVDGIECQRGADYVAGESQHRRRSGSWRRGGGSSIAALGSTRCCDARYAKDDRSYTEASHDNLFPIMAYARAALRLTIGSKGCRRRGVKVLA